MAAEQGVADAQTNLGNLYYNGNGVQQDYSETVKWYRKPAKQGFANAQGGLCGMYVLGQDYLQAYAWCNIAASQGNAWAAKARDIIAQELSPMTLIRAQYLAKEYFKNYVGPFR